MAGTETNLVNIIGIKPSQGMDPIPVTGTVTPGGTTDVDIVAQTVGDIDVQVKNTANIPVDIKAQTVGNINVDLAEQSLNHLDVEVNNKVDIDIAEQSVGNIGIDVKAQTVGNINVDVAEQSVGNINIDIAEQSVGNLGVQVNNTDSIRQYSRIPAGATQVVHLSGACNETAIIYTVTAGKTLYLCLASVYIQNGNGGNQDATLSVRNASDVFQYYLMYFPILENQNLHILLPLNPAIEIPAGYDICAISTGPALYNYCSVFGYEM